MGGGNKGVPGAGGIAVGIASEWPQQQYQPQQQAQPPEQAMEALTQGIFDEEDVEMSVQ
jgi:hypothetical protein